MLDLNAALQDKTGYRIIRSHRENGVTNARIITPVYDSDLKTLSFDADAFSTYAVVYTQTLKPNGGGTDNPGGGTSNPGGSIKKPSTGTSTNKPSAGTDTLDDSTTPVNNNNGAIGNATTENNSSSANTADASNLNEAKDNASKMSAQAQTIKEKPLVLLSAALAAVSILGAVLAWRHKEDEENNGSSRKYRRSRIIATAAVAAILLFLLATGWQGITFANWWTIAVAVPTAGSLIYTLRHK